jgi:endonuclease YncB( thermonuclease family)
MKKIIYLTLSLFITVSLASAKEIILDGRLEVIDGDTIKQGKKRIRLYGIDAPELKQKYEDKNGKKWDCGQVAKTRLNQTIYGKQVLCKTKGKDRYKRILAICYVDGTDINEHMVREGLAESYSQYSEIYESVEEYARSNKKGIWAGGFESPSEYRKKKSKNKR